MDRHTLRGTDYIRCGPGWNCPCLGTARVGLWVQEEIEKPSGSQTNKKFFRIFYRARGESPLMKGYKNAKNHDVNVTLAIPTCDTCAIELLDNNWGSAQWDTNIQKFVPFGTSTSPTTLLGVICEECYGVQ